MNDLFKEGPQPKNPEQRLLKAIFGATDATWLRRENEAREFLSRYIDSHPDDLSDAVVTVSDLSRHVRYQMDYLRDDYLRQEHNGDAESEAENDFAYAHFILILGALRYVLDEYEEKEGDCYIHLCDKGCEAVQAIRKKEREKRC